MSATQIIFKLTIPLLEMDKFKIYQVFRVPFIHGNETWRIETTVDYLVVAFNHQSYQFITEVKCIAYGNDGTKICVGPFHWWTNHVHNCVWNIFNQWSNSDCAIAKMPAENVWLDLKANNEWIFSCYTPQEMAFICGDRVVHYTVTGDGMLRISQNCAAKGMQVHIEARSSYFGGGSRTFGSANQAI